MGQQVEMEPAPKNRFYAGIGVNGRQFIMDYHKTGLFIKYGGSFGAFPYLHLGYQLNTRIQIEVGTAFSNRKDHTYLTYVEAPKK